MLRKKKGEVIIYSPAHVEKVFVNGTVTISLIFLPSINSLSEAISNVF
jgi:hypothetical protein